MNSFVLKCFCEWIENEGCVIEWKEDLGYADYKGLCFG